MKKRILNVVALMTVVTVALFGLSAVAYAAPGDNAQQDGTGPKGTIAQKQDKTKQGSRGQVNSLSYRYLDENGDGICDNYQSGTRGYCTLPGCNYVDTNGDGLCDNRHVHGNGYCNMPGCAYVDENNDGICDNQGTRGSGQNSQGNQNNQQYSQNERPGQGRACGNGYCRNW